MRIKLDQEIIRVTPADRAWWRGLIGGCISAAASAGSGFIGMGVANSAGFDVQPPNLTSLAILLLTSGVAAAFSYLKQSPLPPGSEEMKKIARVEIQKDKDESNLL